MVGKSSTRISKHLYVGSLKDDVPLYMSGFIFLCIFMYVYRKFLCAHCTFITNISHKLLTSTLFSNKHRSGSENYERLPIISLDSLNGPDDLMSSSDHSDKYAHIGGGSHRHHQSYHHSVHQEQRTRHQRHHQYPYNSRTNGDSNRIQDHQGFNYFHIGNCMFNHFILA